MAVTQDENGPVLMLGAGRMGGAILAGWRRANALSGADILVRDPHPGLLSFEDLVLNPPDEALGQARTVILAVKPQIWREAAQAVEAFLAPDAVIISVAAGVASGALSEALGGRAVARVMPTTAVAIGQGVCSLYADQATARERARRLFAPLGQVVDLSCEDEMHAATAVSGSGPAYLYGFVEALEAAGVAAGLEPAQAAGLARATVIGAAALMAGGQDAPAELRRQVTSPGGTTEAALKILMGEDGLAPLLEQAVAAAVARSRQLG
jgi:pyrroline-5-carboxylate reductase